MIQLDSMRFDCKGPCHRTATSWALLRMHTVIVARHSARGLSNVPCVAAARPTGETSATMIYRRMLHFLIRYSNDASSGERTLAVGDCNRKLNEGPIYLLGTWI